MVLYASWRNKIRFCNIFYKLKREYSTMLGLIKKRNAINYTFNELCTISQVKDCIGDFSPAVDRSKIKVYVIDDEGFDSDPLISIGYENIRKCTQFQDCHYFQDADIILCDIDGVGGNIDPIKQGISVAENLKTIYPEKIVVIYTSKDIDVYGGIPNSLDGRIGKSGTMSDLAFELDEYYKKSKDIILAWQKIQKQMLDKNISMKTIAFTEHFYCKSLIDKNNLFEQQEVKTFIDKENIQKFVGILSDIITIYTFVKKG